MVAILQKLLVAVTLLTVGEAQLIPAKRQASSAFCSKVKNGLPGSQHSSATAFCSSYLHISTSVVTTTTSVTTVKARTSTVTVTSTITTGNAGTTTSTSTVTNGISTATVSTCPALNKKRAAAATVPEPAALTRYPSGPTLSSACSCLSVAPKTSTTSVVGTTTTTPKTTTTKKTTVGGTAKVTTTTTVTVPSATTTTNVPPSTCTPYIYDGSFEDIPSSALNQENVVSSTDPRAWVDAGACTFQAGGDGYSTPYGSQYVHFVGGTDRGGQIAQASSGPYDTSTNYTLSFAYRIVANPGVSYSCPLWTEFYGSPAQRLTTMNFTTADAVMSSWATYTSDPFTPFDSKLQLSMLWGCYYDGVEVLVDNFVITKSV